jgi:hypothetical protein
LQVSREELRRHFRFLTACLPGFCLKFLKWPLVCLVFKSLRNERAGVKTKNPAVERRRWPRLPLAIPVFVRSPLEQDKEFLEFATALNVSAGGMLLALRHFLPAAAKISLEIPSGPIATLEPLPSAIRTLRAEVLRTQLGQSSHLVGLKFSQPLTISNSPKARKRKRLSSV